jgi:hypothetical protein
MKNKQYQLDENTAQPTLFTFSSFADEANEKYTY